MSEDRRSKGMYHSLIGKPSLRVGLVMGLLMGLCSVLLLAACGGDNSAKGGAGQEHNKSKSGFAGPASTDGLIVFRRDIDSEGIPNLPYTSCKSAIFTMYPNGSHIRQITHPPEGWSAAAPKGLNAWCEFRDHHPSKSAKANRGRPSCSLSQIEKLCKAILAAKRARNPLSSWGRSRHRPKALNSLS